ncbi:MAG: DUF1343 domain-containing protein [Verrucomicrobiota bacterium]|nr:DUF1343 domain-containing protein [Verrucomicrobiota bacterium]
MKTLRLGIESLLAEHRDWVCRRRVGLVTHQAAVDLAGRASAERFRNDPDLNLAALFAPEHGFFGNAEAGQKRRATRHPRWNIPIHSLYGETQKPTSAMLSGVDVLVFDLQNLPVRCYTYVSTLRLVLEAAARADIPVIVADRPIPLANAVDGPLLNPGFSSFIGLIPSPMVYGLTPGETALWLRDRLLLDVDVRVARMAGYRRQPRRRRGWPPWVAPSPAIHSWDCALCYPATVCFEALPFFDHGRSTALAFQVFAAPWLKVREAAERLVDLRLPGARFGVRRYAPRRGPGIPRAIAGVRLHVTDPDRFRPVLTAVSISCRASRRSMARTGSG